MENHEFNRVHVADISAAGAGLSHFNFDGEGLLIVSSGAWTITNTIDVDVASNGARAVRNVGG
jgi:hypothetical protein